MCILSEKLNRVLRMCCAIEAMAYGKQTAVSNVTSACL